MNNSTKIIITSIFNQLLSYSLLFLFTLSIPCNAQNKAGNAESRETKQAILPKEAINIDIFRSKPTTRISNILSILQDKNGNYWFGTDGAGVYRYSGTSNDSSAQERMVQFTENDGLSGNQVQTIHEDDSGNIWFGTGGYGVSRFDGRTFTTYTSKEILQSGNGSDHDWRIEPGDLWFYAGGGAYRYSATRKAVAQEKSITYLPLPKTDFDFRYSKYPPNRLSAYGVYCTLKDKKGNLWFGTQNMGVCRFDGKSFKWFTEKGLRGPAVLALFEDKKGNIWFGNNGYGLFRYDGKSLTNFTEEKGLANPDFLDTLSVSGKLGLGTMARIYTIKEDNHGILWIGTIDAGVWRYNPAAEHIAGARSLTNFTTKDGLPHNAVSVIYKDRKGELWFGTEGEGLYKFNGVSFTRFDFK